MLSGFRMTSAISFRRRHIHRVSDHINKPDLSVSICQWNRPNESVRAHVIREKRLATCLVRLALNLGTRLYSMGVDPVPCSRTPNYHVGSALKGHKSHESTIWQELEKRQQPIIQRDRHKPGAKPAVRRLNRDWRFYATGCHDQSTPDFPSAQQVSRVGSNLFGFVVVQHG
jgi:hypothetical protein